MSENKKFVHHTLEESPISLIKAFSCAFAGVKHAVLTQRNFKIHLTVAFMAIIMSFLLQLNLVEWAIITVCIFSVFAFECINTAIESIVDMVSPEWSELAKYAKDCAAGAVLLVSIMSAVVALFLFLPKILIMFGFNF